MLPERWRLALASFAQLLRQELGARVLDVRLFGSRARGDATAESDTDVWVLVDRRDEATVRAPFEIATRVMLEHGAEIMPTVMDRGEWNHLRSRERRMARDIEREGIPL